jgi:hypothetical protein
MLLSEKYEKRAKLRAKSEEDYQKLVDSENKQAELKDARKRPTGSNTNVADNSQFVQNNQYTTLAGPNAAAKYDSYAKGIRKNN